MSARGERIQTLDEALEAKQQDRRAQFERLKTKRLQTITLAVDLAAIASFFFFAGTWWRKGDLAGAIAFVIPGVVWCIRPVVDRWSED